MSWIKDQFKLEEIKSTKFSISKTITWLFILVSVSLLAYTYYRHGASFQKAESLYFWSYIATFTMFLFFVVVLYSREKARQNILTIVVVLVVMMYLAEWMLIIIGKPQSYNSKVADNLGIEFDDRSKVQVVLDMISNGLDVVPTVHNSHSGLLYSNDKHPLHPFGGVSNKITVYGNESGSFTIYKSDMDFITLILNGILRK